MDVYNVQWLFAIHNNKLRISELHVLEHYQLARMVIW